jgi:hypothetical protein
MSDSRQSQKSSPRGVLGSSICRDTIRYGWWFLRGFYQSLHVNAQRVHLLVYDRCFLSNPFELFQKLPYDATDSCNKQTTDKGFFYITSRPALAPTDPHMQTVGLSGAPTSRIEGGGA